MSDRYEVYRTSFRKTTIVASGLAVVAILAALASFLIVRATAVAVVFAAVAGLFALFAASGVLVLHRHERERDGIPDLYWSLLMELERSPPRGLLRSLFGPKLRAGTMVRVRSLSEILQTLDERGETDGIPFMPEMLPHCGRTYAVHCVVDKINDWTGRTGTGIRRLKRFVSLRGLRCDGSAHGGCQAGCQILWHESWLARSDGSEDEAEDPPADANLINRRAVSHDGPHPRYKCQITELVRASSKISAWDIRQDLRPLLYGNVNLRAFSVAMATRIFNLVQRLRGGMSYPMMPRQLPSGPTPTGERSDLQPGDEVVALRKEELGLTLHKNYNRGLWFGAENMRFCGQRFTVRTRVERFLDENTGEMVEPKAAFIVLDSAVATGEFLRFCPQYEYVYWREIWLNRASEVDTA